MGDEHLGPRFRAWRVRHDVKQLSVATDLGFSGNTFLSRLEQGKAPLSKELANQWARVLGTTLDQIRATRLLTEQEEARARRASLRRPHAPRERPRTLRPRAIEVLSPPADSAGAPGEETEMQQWIGHLLWVLNTHVAPADKLEAMKVAAAALEAFVAGGKKDTADGDNADAAAE